MKIRFAATLLLAALLAGCGINSVPTAEENAKGKWANVQADYQRRADLIPNLVATVKGAADFEKSTYVQVAQARAGKLNDLTNVKASDLTPERMAQIQQASNEAGQAMRTAINVAIEAYPNLKATQNFSDLQTQLEGTENRINVSRDNFNESATNYNRKVTSFPGNLMAKIFGFKERDLFKADEGAKNAPKVQF